MAAGRLQGGDPVADKAKPDNTSYIFIPFCFEDRKDFRPLVDAMRSSDTWNQEEIQVRYMLKYVADKIKAPDENARQCFQFGLNDQARSGLGLAGKDEWCSTAEYTFRGETVKARFKLVDIKMFCFRTSVGMFAFRVSFENDDPYWISNALFYMKKVSRTELELGSPENKDTMLGISRKLAEEFSDICKLDFFFYAYEKTERANVLTFLTADIKENFNRELFYLRRCYSEGYKYLKNEKLESEELHSPSYGINWGISPEAAVCIACPDAGLEKFLKESFYRNFNSQYLLMYVLLLHQKYVLYKFLTTIGNSDRNDLSKLEDYKNELYEFETDFVFSCITEVPQYQDLYDKIAQSFALRKMYEDVHEPILSLAEVRREETEKEQRQRDKNLNQALILLSILSIFSALVDGYDFVKEFMSEQFALSADVISVIQFVLVIIIILLAVFIIVKILRSKDK